MARIPAICEKCSMIFPSMVNLQKGVTNITFEHCTSMPCPKCGGTGKILDGVYRNILGAVEVFIGQQNINDLKLLLEVLELARKKQWSQEEVISNIKKKTPMFVKLAEYFVKYRTDLYAFLTIFIMIINMLINSGKSNFTKDELLQHIEVTINNYYDSNNKNKSSSESILYQSKDRVGNEKRVGRNAPCPCGSRKKYKKCCGK